MEDQRSAVDIRPGLLVELLLEREERERMAKVAEWEAKRCRKWNVLSGLLAVSMLLAMAVWGGIVLQHDFEMIRATVTDK